METKWRISEHGQNMNYLRGMNKCNAEWENHYKYEDFISEKLSPWREKETAEITGCSLFSILKSR